MSWCSARCKKYGHASVNEADLLYEKKKQPLNSILILCLHPVVIKRIREAFDAQLSHLRFTLFQPVSGRLLSVVALSLWCPEHLWMKAYEELKAAQAKKYDLLWIFHCLVEGWNEGIQCWDMHPFLLTLHCTNNYGTYQVKQLNTKCLLSYLNTRWHHTVTNMA